MQNQTFNSDSTGILDAVSHSQQNQTLRDLNPQQVVFEMLDKVSERERRILIARHGLDDGKVETLERIGQKLGLTRERVRQIEKDAIRKLKAQKLPPELAKTVDLIHDLLKSLGGIVTEEKLVITLLPAKTEPLEKDVLFIFQLSEDFALVRESKTQNRSWALASTDLGQISRTIDTAVDILKESKTPLSTSKLLRQTAARLAAEAFENSSEAVFENLLLTSKRVDRNIFDEWGLAGWPDIRPKDVGDKANLVLKKSGEPQHYETITELINRQKFDEKKAQKETVHNELIKDRRFVLIGRGIYALKEWGFKKGTVGDIIESALIHAGRPLSKVEVINSVLKQRIVKKNTIAVGLANKSRFKKTSDNKYTVLDA